MYFCVCFRGIFAFVFVVFFQELCDSYILLFLAIDVSSITKF